MRLGFSPGAVSVQGCSASAASDSPPKKHPPSPPGLSKRGSKAGDSRQTQRRTKLWLDGRSDVVLLYFAYHKVKENRKNKKKFGLAER
jgi:hypothetical protein